jgi:hypothetical protein
MKKSFSRQVEGIWNPPALDPETMSVADLFGGRCTDCLASLKDDGECPVCGDMPTPGMVATRRQWLKDHPQDLEALFDE